MNNESERTATKIIKLDTGNTEFRNNSFNIKNNHCNINYCFLYRICSIFHKKFRLSVIKTVIQPNSKIDKINSQQLDSNGISGNNSILSSDLRPNREDREISRSGIQETRINQTQRHAIYYKKRRGINDMTRFTLEPKATQEITFSVRKKVTEIEYEVESTENTLLYIVDSKNFQLFMEGKDFAFFNQVTKSNYFHELIAFNPGIYHFLFYNPKKIDVTIGYKFIQQ